MTSLRVAPSGLMSLKTYPPFDGHVAAARKAKASRISRPDNTRIRSHGFAQVGPERMFAHQLVNDDRDVERANKRAFRGWQLKEELSDAAPVSTGGTTRPGLSLQSLVLSLEDVDGPA